MSGQPAKRPKTTPSETQDADQPPGLGLGGSPAVETVKKQGLGQFEHIPAELLEVMLGLLDVRTLCTARCVCRPFLQAASRHLHYLSLSADDISSHPDTNLSSFPVVRRVTVSGIQHNGLGVLQHPNLSAAITNVSMTCNFAYGNPAALRRLASWQGGRLPPLPPLSSLTSLTILHYMLEHHCALPATLRELVFDHPVRNPTAQPLLGLTQLTFLQIAILHENRPFDALTTLHSMRRLEIKSRWSFVPTLAKFPQLTHLVWTPYVDAFEQYNEGQHPILEPLSSLQKLVHLGIRFYCISRQDLAAIGKLTNLRSLDLVSSKAQLDDGNAPVPVFQLTKLGVDCSCMASLMRKVEMEELQELRLANVSRELLPTLERATGLTQLIFDRFDTSSITTLWVPTFGGMSTLQALTMQARIFPSTNCARVVGLLPGLTRLTWVGGHITNDDVSACAALRQLRKLYLLPTEPAPEGQMRPGVFMALAKRPQLTILKLSRFLGSKEDFLADQVKAELNRERHNRGWPPLAIDIDSSY